MRVLLWGAGLFASACVLHLLLWRVRRPRHHIAALLRIWAVVLAGGLAVLPAAAGATDAAGACALLHVALVYAALALAYTVTYTALQVDSPSLVMVLAVDAAGPAGLSREDFERAMTDEALVLPRLADLVRDGVVAEAGGRYRLTGRALGWHRLVLLWRGVLGLPRRGG